MVFLHLVLLPFLYRSRPIVINGFLVGPCFGIVLVRRAFLFLSSAGCIMRLVSMLAYWIPGTFLCCHAPFAFFVVKEATESSAIYWSIAIRLAFVALLLISMWSLNGDVWKGDLLFIGREFLLGRFIAILPTRLQFTHLWPPQGCLPSVDLSNSRVVATAWCRSGNEFWSAPTNWRGSSFVQSILVGLCTGLAYGYASTL